MTTRTWKVYGMLGHRQKESFNESKHYDWTEGTDIRIVEVLNADKTGTNEYSIVKITRNTADECEQELDGQISDGIFENYRTGRVEEITAVGRIDYYGFTGKIEESIEYSDPDKLKEDIINADYYGQAIGVVIYTEDFDSGFMEELGNVKSYKREVR